MAPPKQLREFTHREFHVVVAQDGHRIRAIARDAKRQPVEEASGISVEEVVAHIKMRLNHLSADFFGIEGAINLFRKAYPGGFESGAYQNDERKYKDETSQFMLDHMPKQRIDELLDDGNYAAVAALARQALSTSNLAFPNEQMALRDALKAEQIVKPFAQDLRELLYGDVCTALTRLASLLKPYGAAKWPILTFWPFFRFPERHMFLKPMIAQKFAHQLGYEFDYDPMPNAETYRSLLGLTAFIRDGIATLKPKDNIDIQSFMFVVAGEA